MKKGGLFIFLIAFILLFFLIFTLSIRAEDSESSSSSEWLMYRKYLNHTAWDGVSFTKIHGLNRANFTLVAGGSNIWSSPAVANGYVYMAGGSQIYQLNASNVSQKIANFSADGTSYSAPSIVNGFVYVGGGGSQIYQLNASNISQRIANFSTGGTVRSTPAIANGFVYVGSYDGKFYQLNASNVSLHVANFTTGNYIRGSAAIANGFVYVGSADNQTYQLNASNVSQLIANVSMPNVISSPAVANGYVYIADYAGVAYQLNASNISEKICNYTGPIYFQSSPAVANGFVYIGTWNGYLYQFNASNISQRISYFYAAGSIYSSPAVANGFVYFGALGSNKTFQLNASNVSISVANFSTDGYVYSSPAVANGYVYIGSDGAQLYQLNADNISKENDFYPPDINFTSPTPANASFQSRNSVYVNVSTSDVSEHSAWIDWNRTLVGWWNFEWINSTNGTFYDNSSYNRHGRLINATVNATTTGKMGQGLEFDGLTYYANIGTPLLNSTEWTYSVWFYPRSNGSVSALIGQGNNPALRWGSMRRVYLFIGCLNCSGTSYKQIGSPDLELNQWHHAVGVVNLSVESNQSETLYIDGARVSTASWSHESISNETRNGTIVRPDTIHYLNIRDSSRSFNGTIDEVMVFSRALTPQEINASYNAGTYKLYNNFTNLSDALYTYRAYAIDNAGNVNSTEENTININSTLVFNCTNLDVVGKNYFLQSDIINNEVTSLACINITKQNITLDCQGHLIFSVQNISGIYTIMRNVTIQNCNVDIGGGNKTNVSAVGIYYNYTGQYGKILNNTVNATYGIYLNYYANGNTLANNTAYGGPLGRAIYLNIASNNNLTSNTGITLGGYTIIIEQSSNDNLLKDNIGVSSSLPGIRIGVTYNNILINNTGASNISVGIYLLGTRNATLINNTGISNISYGINLDSASNNTFINNTGITNSWTYGVGILIRSIGGYPVARNNTFINNTATTNSTYAVYLQNTTDNSFYNQIAVGYSSSSKGVSLNYYAINNTFQDCVNVSGAIVDVNVSLNSINNTFINCSYNSSKEIVDSTSQLIRKWYYSAYVNDTSGNNVSNANITAYNSTNDYQFNLTTSDTGYTSTTKIVDYFNDNGTRTYYSNYTIYAINSSYSGLSHDWNATLQKSAIDMFTFTVIVPPAEIPEGGGEGGCTYDWVCSDWYPQPCNQAGIQKRVCVNRGTCDGEENMPTLNRTCTPEVFEPTEPLFDIFVNIPLQSKWILKGDNVSFDVNLINVGNKTTIDVFLQYLVINANNSLIAEKKETRAIGERDKFTIELPLPENLEEGTYRVYVQIDYDEGKVATAGDSFEIVKDNYTLILRRIVSFLPILAISIIFVLILIKLLTFLRKKPKYRKRKMERREKLVKKKKRKEYAKKYKKEKRRAEREMRLENKYRKKKKKIRKRKKKEKIRILEPQLNRGFIEKRKFLEEKQRKKRIIEMRKIMKQKK
jgi:parallel beta-helix repeat protein